MNINTRFVYNTEPDAIKGNGLWFTDQSVSTYDAFGVETDISKIHANLTILSEAEIEEFAIAANMMRKQGRLLAVRECGLGIWEMEFDVEVRYD
jgi:hypothetical protein